MALSHLFNFTAVLLKVRPVISDFPVVADSHKDQIAFIVFQSFRILLPVDLTHGSFRRMIILEFNQKRRNPRIPGNVCQIRISLSSIQFRNDCIIILRTVISKLDSIAQIRFTMIDPVTGLVTYLQQLLPQFSSPQVPQKKSLPPDHGSCQE